MMNKKPGTNMTNAAMDKGKEKKEEISEMAGRPKKADQKKPKFKTLDEVKAYAKQKYGI